MTKTKKPVELQQKLGKPGKRDPGTVHEVAEPVDGPPPIPANLRDAGAELWVTVTRAAALWVSESDLPALAQLCRLHDQYADVKRRMELAEDDETFLKYSLEARKILDVQRGVFSDMGLNPVSRGKLGLTVATTKEITSKLDRWLK